MIKAHRKHLHSQGPDLEGHIFAEPLSPAVFKMSYFLVTSDREFVIMCSPLEYLIFFFCVQVISVLNVGVNFTSHQGEVKLFATEPNVW